MTTARNTGHPEGSWYADTVGRLNLPAFQGEVDTDVAIIGGGYTGLGAALELARKGVSVTLLEGAEIGSGASGRNGGQLHTGQRVDPQTLESQLGADAARELWEMAETAKTHLHGLIDTHGIDCELRHGLIHAWHRPRFADEDRAYADFVSQRYGYNKLRFMDKAEVTGELGTDVYHGGLFDAGGGHLHPLKLALGLARAAMTAGATLYERSRVTRYETTANGVTLHLKNGRLRARKLLICGNGYMPGLDAQVDAHVLPINNFILTTAPLPDDLILPHGFAAADSRFVVNYWRKTPDNRLLFGGGENYTPWFPKDIRAFVRRNMLKVYPQLETIEITHGWGGTLAITLSRAPFVRLLTPDVWVSAGYSGQGVVLAPYFGTLLARAVMGNDRDAALLSQLKTPPFPGGKWLRTPAMIAGLSWYALRDRL
ncbi:FAD-binding oxidoreductase [Asticcacaulis sp. AND118]|uniref:NAD(P)/FAD-dependent oxidoreductase n=1 Tax=Asticcacaulis sp. AND118 TaxID=2840468 RepID=UPI001CFFF6FA|nr:FAD-binding oxidoreductase [Asticcacaulis sp. AND118]UDF04376.1 FAD-binding oxidoreductase [Asticcacaulis sp. AND118]